MQIIISILILFAFISLIIRAMELSVKVDRLDIELKHSKKETNHYKDLLTTEREYTDHLLELAASLKDQIGALKKTPYIVEKKAEVKTFNFEKIYPLSKQEFIDTELKDIACNEFKLSLPNSYIKYEVNRKPYSMDLIVKASIKIIVEPLE